MAYDWREEQERERRRREEQEQQRRREEDQRQQREEEQRRQRRYEEDQKQLRRDEAQRRQQWDEDDRKTRQRWQEKETQAKQAREEEWNRLRLSEEEKSRRRHEEDRIRQRQFDEAWQQQGQTYSSSSNQTYGSSSDRSPDTNVGCLAWLVGVGIFIGVSYALIKAVLFFLHFLFHPLSAVSEVNQPVVHPLDVAGRWRNESLGIVVSYTSANRYAVTRIKSGKITEWGTWKLVGETLSYQSDNKVDSVSINRGTHDVDRRDDKTLVIDQVVFQRIEADQ